MRLPEFSRYLKRATSFLDFDYFNAQASQKVADCTLFACNARLM